MSKKSKEFIENLPKLAWEYVEECKNHTRQKLANTGEVIDVADRHIPTVQYFLRIWIPSKGMDSLGRTQWYEWLRNEDEAKANTIKEITDIFDCLATDIVANEGKGIFYAKNKLGMTDKTELSGNKEQPLFGPDVN